MRLMIFATLLLTGCAEGTERISEIDEAGLAAAAKQMKCEQSGCEPPPEYEWEAEITEVQAKRLEQAPTSKSATGEFFEEYRLHEMERRIEELENR